MLYFSVYGYILFLIKLNAVFAQSKTAVKEKIEYEKNKNIMAGSAFFAYCH